MPTIGNTDWFSPTIQKGYYKIKTSPSVDSYWIKRPSTGCVGVALTSKIE